MIFLMRELADSEIKGSFWSQIRLAYGLLPVVNLLEKRAIDPVPALKRAGIDRFGLLDPGYTIPIDKELAFLRSAINLLNDPAASLDLASEYRVKGFSVLGLAMLACETPLQILLLLLRYPRLAWGVFDCEFYPVGAKVQVAMMAPAVLGDAEGFLLERDLACAQVLITEVLGQPFHFGRIEFRHACRGERSRFEDFFACPVHFEAPANQVSISQQVLGQSMPQASDSLLRFYELQCEHMSRQLEQPFRFVDAVRRQLLRSAIVPDLKTLAAEFFMTPRTLQRRLAKEGLSYSELLQSVRESRAKTLLQDASRSMESISEELGFSDGAAFSHAFKAWTGQSPQSFRRGIEHH